MSVDETPPTVPTYCPKCGSKNIQVVFNCPRCSLELYECVKCRQKFSIDYL